MSTLIVILAFIVVLGPLVLVHELGHFLAAKLFGVRVEVFSIGFGPRLAGVRRGETDYRIAPIPLGGYVRMAGEYTESDSPMDPALLNNKPRWQRLCIMLAGPAVNVLFAGTVWWGLFMHGVAAPEFPEGPPIVEVVAADSPAARAGIRPGDTILAVGDTDLKSFEQFLEEVAFRPGQPTVYTVEREGRQLRLDVEIAKHEEHQLGWDGVFPRLPIALGRILPGGPAESAGMREKDRILAVNGSAPKGQMALIELIEEHADREMTFTVRRDEEVLDITVVPRPDEAGNGKIAAELGLPVRFVRYGPLEAAARSAAEIRRQSGLVFRTVAALVTRNLGLSALSGPLEIARVSRAQMSLGWAQVLQWMAALSLQLGILNLLPIPVLDGGQILLLLVEAARRRDLAPAVKEKVLITGFVMIVLLMGTVIVLDVMKGMRRSARTAPAVEAAAPAPEPSAPPDGRP